MSPHARFLAATIVSLLPCAPALALSPAEVAGEYTAVVDNGSFETSGSFRMVLGKAGFGSVAVKLGDEPVCVVGVGFGGGFNPPGSVYFRSGDADMIVHLTITIGEDGNPVVAGDVEDDGHVYQVEAPKVATTAGPASGRYTFAFGSTANSRNAGSGLARVSASGRVTGAASVKGGPPVTFGGRLSPAQVLPIAARLGRTDSSVVGSVTFTGASTTGNVALHAETGDQALLVGGKPYNPRQPSLTGEYPDFSLEVTLDGAVSGSAVGRFNGAIRGGTLNGKPLRLAVSHGTGLVTGRSGTQVFRGVALQGDNLLAGLVNRATPFQVYPVSTVQGFANQMGGLRKVGVGNVVLGNLQINNNPPLVAGVRQLILLDMPPFVIGANYGQGQYLGVQHVAGQNLVLPGNGNAQVVPPGTGGAVVNTASGGGEVMPGSSSGTLAGAGEVSIQGGTFVATPWVLNTPTPEVPNWNVVAVGGSINLVNTNSATLATNAWNGTASGGAVNLVNPNAGTLVVNGGTLIPSSSSVNVVPGTGTSLQLAPVASILQTLPAGSYAVQYAADGTPSVTAWDSSTAVPDGATIVIKH